MNATAPSDERIAQQPSEQLAEIFSHMGWVLRPVGPQDIFCEQEKITWVVETPVDLNCTYEPIGYTSFEVIEDLWGKVADCSLRRHHQLCYLQAYYARAADDERAKLRHWCDTGEGLPLDFLYQSRRYVKPTDWEAAVLLVQPRRFCVLTIEEAEIELRRELKAFTETLNLGSPLDL